MKLWQWLVALASLIFRRRRSGVAEPELSDDRVRTVTPGAVERRAEVIVVALLGVAALLALGFIVVYGLFSPAGLPNELLGLCLGLSLVCIGIALTVVAKCLVVTEELEEDYPQSHPEQQSAVADIIRRSGSRITRKRLLLGASAVTGGALTLAAVTPALSLGPLWDTAPLDETPWRRGTRVVDEQGRPLAAGAIMGRTFYTGFPEGADQELIGSSLVIVRVDPAKLHLPAGRAHWAPDGILAFSKICTHAGCAVALYRKPTDPQLEPNNALVCPCHYSTFDPYTGGTVIYGPAGRPLPQLPLAIDAEGNLRATGNFSGRVGPSWWAVRERPND
jgi:ubiquinol-cytochrome c reductase iron-sulfur subunit